APLPRTWSTRFVPPVTTVKSNPRMEAMFARLLSFGAQMALDLDSLEFLSA
ncbi:MAG: hypothetical protein INR66_19605, partial [Gordonia polyisoprenivorans]|nr:hypothetical protein [Gordonia polyisoprenivorans]